MESSRAIRCCASKARANEVLAAAAGLPECPLHLVALLPARAGDGRDQPRRDPQGPGAGAARPRPGEAAALSARLPNQSIDNSDADLARDLRRIVREQLIAGRSDQEIIGYLTARYGDFVLLKPPVNTATWGLWFGPALVLLIGAGGIVLYVARHRRAQDAPAAPLSAEERTLLDALVARRRGAPIDPDPPAALQLTSSLPPPSARRRRPSPPPRAMAALPHRQQHQACDRQREIGRPGWRSSRPDRRGLRAAARPRLR